MFFEGNYTANYYFTQGYKIEFVHMPGTSAEFLKANCIERFQYELRLYSELFITTLMSD